MTIPYIHVTTLDFFLFLDLRLYGRTYMYLYYGMAVRLYIGPFYVLGT